MLPPDDFLGKMSSTAIIWAFVTGATLTLAALHLRIGINQKIDGKAHVLFSIMGFGVALYAPIEYLWMHSATPQDFSFYGRLIQIPVFIVIISVPWFVKYYLGYARPWLFWGACIWRLVNFPIGLLITPTLQFREITNMRAIEFLGDQAFIPEGSDSAWILFDQGGIILLLVFCIDASIQAWRRGNRRRATIVGALMCLFWMLVLIQTEFGFRGLDTPVAAAPMFLAVLVAMGYDLSSEVLRSWELARALDKRESDLYEAKQRLGISADAANVGVWVHDLSTGSILAGDKWYEIFGFDRFKELSIDAVMSRIHEEDRELVAKMRQTLMGRHGEIEFEYRITLPDGEVRWVRSHAVADRHRDKSLLIRSASVDITQSKVAEAEAQELGGQLIGEQEMERSRLARELHDGLSQNLALLSIRLEALGMKPENRRNILEQVDELSEDLHRLSLDVHRMSYELHPAKLEQLGLEAALRGFCREINSLHSVNVTFEPHDVPWHLPRDIALCLYRIAQESLWNAVKHSGASKVLVKLDLDRAAIRLRVVDDGCGFNVDAPRRKSSLGLLSMRERARSVNGTVGVCSFPAEGTSIEARIPYVPNSADVPVF